MSSIILGDYEQNLICNDPNNCVPCDQRNPSCFGISNGNHPFPGQPNMYIVCFKERTIRTETCDVGQFNPLTGECSVIFDSSKLYDKMLIYKSDIAYGKDTFV